jgi:hypothetical protein
MSYSLMLQTRQAARRRPQHWTGRRYPWQIVAPPGAREIQPADLDRKLITPSLFERPAAKLAAPEPFAGIARSSFEYRRRHVDHAG